ncbi:MAG TPA: MarR family transcriptional regulator [Ktedonobacteraceae bacterium]|jgi:DNA-binding MarR family transcriptional regulator|nr:MarR family transcriptional regulator [Ktedonobacteraceae bacterium]
MSQALNDSLHEVMDLFFIFGYELQKTAARQWWDLDLTMAQFKVLLTIVFEGQVAIGTIAETLGIGPPTASHLVDRLVQAGLVERVEYSVDRRYTLARLTPQGELMMRRLRQGRMDQLQSYLTHLDSQDLAALHQGLKALVRILPSVLSQEKEIGRL